MVGFKILLAEDEPKPLDQLVKLLGESFPGLMIDTAVSISQAVQCIDAAIEAGLLYDLAILDFKLPQVPGGTEEVDESVCRRLMASMPDTIVGHITSYKGDPHIEAHIKLVHPAGRSRGFFLDKRDSGFANDLIRATGEALYGSRIEREIKEVFSAAADPHPDGEGARTAGSRRSSSVANRIVDLCLDISSTWKELNPATKARVREFFSVDEKPAGTLVVPR